MVENKKIELIYGIIDFETGISKTLVKYGKDMIAYDMPIAKWAIRKYRREKDENQVSLL